MNEIQKPGISNRIKTVPRLAWILILISDAGMAVWGGAAALATKHLTGPDATPILEAEYQNFTGLSWSQLSVTSPKVADFITILFRMYGTYCMLFGMLTVAITITAFRKGERWAWWALLIGNTIAYGSAITFDLVVKAVGIFEMTEYLGIAMVYVALALTAPLLATRR
ncbi:MAG TPA: hypothetical protein VF144_06415 [Chitinophagaceae bacterium]